MKYKKKLANLQARIKAWEADTKKSPKDIAGFKKPGSQKG